MEVSKQNFEIPWLLNKNHHDNKIFLNNWIMYSEKATKFGEISTIDYQVKDYLATQQDIYGAP